MLIIILFLSLFATSCSVFNYLEVELIGPEQGELDLTCSEFCFEFSKNVDQIQTEANIIYLENSQYARKSFIWENNVLKIIPENNIQNGIDYKIIFPANIESKKGSSLSGEKIFNFTTKKENIITEITGITIDNKVFSQDTKSFIIEANNSLDLFSAYYNITIEPNLDGYFSFADGKCSYVLKQIPLANTNYTVLVSEQVRDKNNLHIKKEFVKEFIYSEDLAEAKIINACTVDEELVVAEIKGNIISAAAGGGFRVNEKFSFTFNHELSKLNYAVQITPDIRLKIEEEDSSIILSASPQFNFNQTYTITINYKLKQDNKDFTYTSYKIKTDSNKDLPPRCIALYFQGPNQSEPVKFNDRDVIVEYMQDFNIGDYADFYILIAKSKAADIPLLSLIKNLSISSSAINFRILDIAKSPVTNFEEYISEEDVEVFKVNTSIQNKALVNGIVNFTIMQGLEDSLGNRTTSNYELKFFK